MPIQIRIFIGYVRNTEMSIHLNQSSKWKEAKLTGATSLQETDLENKKYIGHFVSSQIPYPELKKIGENIKTELQNYSPKLNLDKHSIYVFPQVFYS